MSTAALAEQLSRSTSAAALPAVLALCPAGVRVAAWHRGERPAASRRPLNAWEPVIYHGGRPADPSRSNDPLQSRRVDSLVHGVSPLTTLPSRVTGTKPAAFCRWVFELLGAAPGDELDDLFPGSGVVGRAWAAYAGSPGERDASTGSAHDASARAARYPSAEAFVDASAEVLNDALPRGLDDASLPTSGATPALTDN